MAWQDVGGCSTKWWIFSKAIIFSKYSYTLELEKNANTHKYWGSNLYLRLLEHVQLLRRATFYFTLFFHFSFHIKYKSLITSFLWQNSKDTYHTCVHGQRCRYIFIVQKSFLQFSRNPIEIAVRRPVSSFASWSPHLSIGRKFLRLAVRSMGYFLCASNSLYTSKGFFTYFYYAVYTSSQYRESKGKFTGYLVYDVYWKRLRCQAKSSNSSA